MTDHEPEKADDQQNADFLQILAHYQQSVTEQLAAVKNTLRTAVLPGLIACRVANVEAAYSGYGDSGAIDGVQYRDKAGQRVERKNIPAELTERLENILYEFLPAGFENNDGGQGTLTLDTHSGRLTLKHQENFTETRDGTREFDL